MNVHFRKTTGIFLRKFINKQMINLMLHRDVEVQEKA